MEERRENRREGTLRGGGVSEAAGREVIIAKVRDCGEREGRIKTFKE